jgi:ABC-type transport system involved in multi-copper enzyme maturation permease subunit
MTKMTSDDSAVSGRTHELPSPVSQIITVFGAQMRLYSKSKIALVFIALALLIPILSFSGAAEKIIDTLLGAPPSTSYLLAFLPLFIIVIPAMLAGRILSSEFKNRTVYMLFTLPVSRSTYYIGKFLAAFVLSTGIFAVAYAFAVISGASLYGPSYPNNVMGSFIVCIAGVFAISATAYGLSAYLKKGSTGLVIGALLFLPMILAVIMQVYDLDLGVLKTIPPFTGYQSMHLLDMGLGGAFLGDMFRWLTSTYSIFVYVIMSAIWGAAFFALGLMNTDRKEL